MKFKTIMEEMKMVQKIRTGKNKSYKCDTFKEFVESLQELNDGLVTIIADVTDKVVYVVGRTSFHMNLAKEWNLPKSSNDRYIHLIGSFSDKGFAIDKLQMSSLSRKVIEGLDSKNWIRRLM